MDYKEYIIEKKWMLGAGGACTLIAVVLEFLLLPSVYRLGMILISLLLGIFILAICVMDELKSRTAKQEMILQDLQELVETPGYSVPKNGTQEEKDLAEKINGLSGHIASLCEENERDRQDLADYIRIWTPKLEENLQEFRNIANSALRSDVPNLLERQVDQTNLTVQQLLYYLRTKTDGINSRKVPVSVNDVALQTIKRYYPMMQQKRIGYLIKGQDILIQTDPDILSFAFGQVLENAIKYSPQKSSIGVYIKRFQGSYYLIVEDKGTGINPSDLPYVFNKNYIGKNEPDESSPGMGLYLARSFIELLGYEIGLNSKLNQGTTVAICFMNEDAVPNKRAKKQPPSYSAVPSAPAELRRAREEDLPNDWSEGIEAEGAEEREAPEDGKKGAGDSAYELPSDSAEPAKREPLTPEDELEAAFEEIPLSGTVEIPMEIERFVPKKERGADASPETEQEPAE